MSVSLFVECGQEDNLTASPPQFLRQLSIVTSSMTGPSYSAARLWLYALLTCAVGVDRVNVSVSDSTTDANAGHDERHGKNLLQWLGIEEPHDADPYLTRANSLCLEGDLYECFKHRVLSTFDDFLQQEKYNLSENVRLVRMPKEELRRIAAEPYEFSSEQRAEEPEWDQFVKFVMRKVERFVKSSAFEVQVPDEFTVQGRYAPRFIDEIYSEIDTLEDKNDNSFSRTKLKKLFIPMLIILKLFKLKLLLFLPLILGLASFKKVLGFIALVVPGVIGFFKLCKPDLHHNYGSYGHSNFYHSPPHKYNLDGFALPNRKAQTDQIHSYQMMENSGQISFKETPLVNGDLAYQAYYQQKSNTR